MLVFLVLNTIEKPLKKELMDTMIVVYDDITYYKYLNGLGKCGNVCKIRLTAHSNNRIYSHCIKHSTIVIIKYFNYMLVG